MLEARCRLHCPRCFIAICAANIKASVRLILSTMYILLYFLQLYGRVRFIWPLVAAKLISVGMRHTRTRMCSLLQPLATWPDPTSRHMILYPQLRLLGIEGLQVMSRHLSLSERIQSAQVSAPLSSSSSSRILSDIRFRIAALGLSSAKLTLSDISVCP